MSDKTTVFQATAPKDEVTTKKTDPKVERDRMEDEGGAMGLSFQEKPKSHNKS